MRKHILLSLALWGMVFTGSAGAQQIYATVVETAPIYIFPDATRIPLRTVAVNTQLRVLAQEGDWLRVEFNDRQFGPRVGYVIANKVRLSKPAVRPADGGVQAPPSQTPSLEPPSTVRPTDRVQALPSGTQLPEPPKATPRPVRHGQSFRRGFKGYGTYGGTAFAASETFEAVTGSARSSNMGGGVVITNLWRNLFIDAGVSRSKVDGQRVFADGDTIYQLGIPLSVSVTPIDAAAGWRIGTGRFSTFVGGGVTFVAYEETDAFAEADDKVKERTFGGLVLAGVDVAVTKWLQVGGEVRYRSVMGILGQSGASSVFGDDEVGGLAAGVRLSFGK